MLMPLCVFKNTSYKVLLLFGLPAIIFLFNPGIIIKIAVVDIEGKDARALICIRLLSK